MARRTSWVAVGVAVAGLSVLGGPRVGAASPRADGHARPHATIRAGHLGVLPTLSTWRARGMGEEAAATTTNLSYGGGTDGVGVTTGAPRVYLVFWGSQWGTQGTNASGDATFSGDRAGMAPDLEAFFKGLGTGGETWSGTMTQYCQLHQAGGQTCTGTDPHVGYPTGGAFAGLWEDTSSKAPAAAGSYQLGEEAVRAAGHFGNVTPAENRYAQYVIVSPTGTDPDHYQENKFCAWHDDTGYPGVGIDSTYGSVAFTNLPYIPDAGKGCGKDFVNSNGTLDGVTLTAGHEYAETITDQFPAGGWTSGGNESEAADLCDWISTGQGAAHDLTLPTGTFAVQSIWSNDFNGGKGGCVLSHPTVTGQNAAPDAPSDLAATPGDLSAAVGWNAPPSDGGAAILDYTATAIDATTPANGGETCTAPGTLTCTVTGLTNGDTYTFTVNATNSIGTGPSSAPSGSVIPANLPGAPTSVTASPGNGSLTVHWVAPADDGGSPIVQYSVVGSPGGVGCVTATAVSCSIGGLRPTSAYSFSVVAWNSVGSGPSSANSAPVFPFSSKGLGLYTPTTVLSPSRRFYVVAAGAAPASSVHVTLQGAAPQQCVASAAGQCEVILE